MAGKPNPAHSIVDAFCRNWGGIAANLKTAIAANMKRGDAPDVATVKAFAHTRTGDATVRAIFGSVVDAFVKGSATFGVGKRTPDAKNPGTDTVEKFVRTSWLNRSFDADGVRLSDRIHGVTAENKKMVLGAVRQQMYLGKSWNATATAVYKQGVTGGDVTKILPELHNRARLALETSKDFVSYRKEVDSAIEAAQKYVSRLGGGGAPNQKLKAAYQRVIDATEAGSIKAMDDALTRAIDHKSRYNAERVARTEIARAWGQTFFNSALDDDMVIGYRWMTSSRHPNYDICDFHENANLYGMGAGIYPKESGPSYPAHPHCLCVLVEVFEGEAVNKGFSPKAGQKHLERLDPMERKALLGVSGGKKWQDGEDWQAHLKGWSGEVEKKKVEIIDKKWEKETNYQHQLSRGAIKPPVVVPKPTPPTPQPLAVAPVPVAPVAVQNVQDFSTVPKFKSTAEASKWLEDAGHVGSCDFKGFHIEVAQATVEGIHDAVSKFPAIKGNLEFVGTAQEQYRRAIEIRYSDFKAKKDIPGGSFDRLRAIFKDDARVEKEMRAFVAKINGITKTSGKTFAVSVGGSPVGRGYHGVEGIVWNEKHIKNISALKDDLQRLVDIKSSPIGGNTPRYVVDHEMAHQIDRHFKIDSHVDTKTWYNSILDIENDLCSYAKTNINEGISEAYGELLNNPMPRPTAMKFKGILEKITGVKL